MACDMTLPRAATLAAENRYLRASASSDALKHVTAGGRAHAGVEPDRRLLDHGVPAGFGISAVELAAEQRAEMGGFKLSVEFGVPGDDLADAGQYADRRDDLGDRGVQRRFDHRPGFGENVERVAVEAVHLETSLEGLHQIGLRHGGKTSTSRRAHMVCENRCRCVNELVTNRGCTRQSRGKDHKSVNRAVKRHPFRAARRHRQGDVQPPAGPQRLHLRDVRTAGGDLPGGRRRPCHQGAGIPGRRRQGLRGRHRHQPISRIHHAAACARLRSPHRPRARQARDMPRADHRGDQRRLHRRRRRHRGVLRHAHRHQDHANSASRSRVRSAIACRCRISAGSPR